MRIIKHNEVGSPVSVHINGKVVGNQFYIFGVIFQIINYNSCVLDLVKYIVGRFYDFQSFVIIFCDPQFFLTVTVHIGSCNKRIDTQIPSRRTGIFLEFFFCDFGNVYVAIIFTAGNLDKVSFAVSVNIIRKKKRSGLHTQNTVVSHECYTFRTILLYVYVIAGCRCPAFR